MSDHENGGIYKRLNIEGGSNDMWPMAMAMMNNCNRDGFGGNSWMGLILVLALLGRGDLFGRGVGHGHCGPEGSFFGAGGMGSGILCTLQNSLNELSGKLLSTQIALAGNITALGADLTQNINANFANTNGQLREMNGQMVNGFSSAAMERCAMTAKLATDINQVGAANLAAINNTTEKVMCGFNGLNANLFNVASNIKDQATANFTVLDKNDAAIACGVDKLSVQSACETKDIINVSNLNTQQILCAIGKTNDNIALSEQKLSKQISDLHYQNEIAELKERLHHQNKENERNEITMFQNNMNRNFQLMNDSIGFMKSRLDNIPLTNNVNK